MPYVSRNAGKEVVGLYARPQPGLAEERLDDSDAEVVAFRERRIPVPRDLATELDEQRARTDRLEAALIARGAISDADVVAR